MFSLTQRTSNTIGKRGGALNYDDDGNVDDNDDLNDDDDAFSKKK